SAVSKKIRTAKEIKDIENLRTTYDGIINEILQEREEAVRIAQAYKSELDRMVISDEDIEHLHNTVARLLELFNLVQLSSGEDNKVSTDTLEQIKELISVDTLKAMQLLGFNYKEAIGEPLTQLCADAIKSLAKRKIQTNNKQNKHH
ncbi:MAG: hypothetical protein IKN56_07355, partial [Clostridia bacterium]|nr:hypothetical protein [Clostridia bacterium]